MPQVTRLVEADSATRGELAVLLSQVSSTQAVPSLAEASAAEGGEWHSLGYPIPDTGDACVANTSANVGITASAFALVSSDMGL